MANVLLALSLLPACTIADLAIAVAGVLTSSWGLGLYIFQMYVNVMLLFYVPFYTLFFGMDVYINKN